MGIDYFMRKLNHYSFKREQLDIIDNFNKKEEKIFKYLFFSYMLFLFLFILGDNGIINNILSIIIVVESTVYIFFQVFKRKYLLRLLKRSINNIN